MTAADDRCSPRPEGRGRIEAGERPSSPLRSCLARKIRLVLHGPGRHVAALKGAVAAVPGRGFPVLRRPGLPWPH